MVTRWTVKELKANMNTVPFLFNFSLYAFDMEDVLAFKLNTRLLVKPVNVANATELFSAKTKSLSLIFLHAFGVEARKTFNLVSETTTSMIAS